MGKPFLGPGSERHCRGGGERALTVYSRSEMGENVPWVLSVGCSFDRDVLFMPFTPLMN